MRIKFDFKNNPFATFVIGFCANSFLVFIITGNWIGVLIQFLLVVSNLALIAKFEKLDKN